MGGSVAMLVERSLDVLLSREEKELLSDSLISIDNAGWLGENIRVG